MKKHQGILRLALLFAVPIFFFSPVSSADEGYRTFTSSDGRQIKARIVEATNTSVTIRLDTGLKYYDVPLSRFSPEDRSYVRKWREEERLKIDDADLNEDSKIKIRVHKGEDDDKNSYGDIDDRVVQVKPTVIVESDEIEKTFKDVNGTLVIIGEGVAADKDKFMILLRQDFTITLSPKSEVRWESRRTDFRYDPDYGGVEYNGYLVVLRNKKGDVVFARSSRNPWEKYPEKLLKAKVKKGYDRDFSEPIEFMVRWGF